MASGWTTPTARKFGHFMLITAYDDAYAANTRAVRIQNSFGKRWGQNGFVWMVYQTLEAMAQGSGVYLPDSVWRHPAVKLNR
jgi:C1A family cysteine protease